MVRFRSVIVNTSIEVINSNKNNKTITIITVKHKQLQTFRHVHKIAKSNYLTCEPVHPSAWKNSASTGWIFITLWKFKYYFSKTCQESSRFIKADKNKRYFT